MNLIALLNYVANQPEVLRHVAPGYANIDLTAFCTKPGNYIMGDEGGCVIFAPSTANSTVYEMHYLLTNDIRGRDALYFTRFCLELMFTKQGATAITGLTPRDNRAARAMNRALGARPVGEQTDIFGRLCIKYVLEREQWVQFSAASSAVSVH